MGKRDINFRFAFGREAAAHSSIWRLFSTTNDVYMSTRSLGGALKASLHESGECAVAFTEQYVAKQRSADAWWRESRRVDTWTPASNIRAGVTLAMRIAVPDSELREYPVSTSRAVKWLPPPPAGHTAEVCVFLLDLAWPEGSWPGQTSHSTLPVFHHVLPNGKHLWLVQRQDPTSDGTRARIEQVRTALATQEPDQKAEGWLLPSPSKRLIVGGDEADGSRVWLEIAFDSVSPGTDRGRRAS